MFYASFKIQWTSEFSCGPVKGLYNLQSSSLHSQFIGFVMQKQFIFIHCKKKCPFVRKHLGLYNNLDVAKKNLSVLKLRIFFFIFSFIFFLNYSVACRKHLTLFFSWRQLACVCKLWKTKYLQNNFLKVKNWATILSKTCCIFFSLSENFIFFFIYKIFKMLIAIFFTMILLTSKAWKNFIPLYLFRWNPYHAFLWDIFKQKYAYMNFIKVFNNIVN